MKKLLHATGKFIDHLTGRIGGFVLAVLIVCMISALKRLFGFEIPYTGWVYFMIVMLFSIIGKRRYKIFALYMTPLFNVFCNDTDGISNDMGPDTESHWSDFFINLGYLTSVLLIIIAFLFTAKTPLCIGAVLLLIYSFHVLKSQ